MIGTAKANFRKVPRSEIYMNQSLFLTINGLAGQWVWLDKLGVFFAQYFLYIFALVIVGLLAYKEYRRNSILALVSALISLGIIVEVLKRVVNHPRPFEVINQVNQLLQDGERGKSFPSGHATIFFAFAFAFYGTKWF